MAFKQVLKAASLFIAVVVAGPLLVAGCFAPAPDGPLDATLLECVTYLTPNETEAQRLTGIDVSDEDSAKAAAEKLLDAGARNVIVTLGAKGALVASAEASVLVPGYKVEAADSTAAGDAFNGALAAALASGQSLDEAVRQANLVGALSVTRLGAQPSLPTVQVNSVL